MVADPPASCSWRPGALQSTTTTTSDEDGVQTQWQGKDVTFMQSNDHSHDRRGVWDASGLEGAEAALVKGVLLATVAVVAVAAVAVTAHPL
jgi:hypothetical protein